MSNMIRPDGVTLYEQLKNLKNLELKPTERISASFGDNNTRRYFGSAEELENYLSSGDATLKDFHIIG
jgi:hypothetical protein